MTTKKLISVVSVVLALLAVVTPAAAASARPASYPNICYQGHFSNRGWDSRFPCNRDGGPNGTWGIGYPFDQHLEALRVQGTGIGRFCISAHVQNIGWMQWQCGDDTHEVWVGTTGQGLAMEAIEFKTDDPNVSLCGLPYEADWGWRTPIQDGHEITVGTQGQNEPLNGIELWGVPVNTECQSG